MAALAKKFDVLAPEHPGFGASDTPEWLDNVADLANFYLDFLEQLDLTGVHLIGSSLGGFWAQVLAPEFDASMVLINPSVRPDETLARHVGRYRNEATGGETVLTATDVAELRHYRVEPCDPRVPTLVLLDSADEVLDYRVAEAAFRGCGRTLVYPGGSHRFEHLPEALPEIRALYRG